MYPTPEFPDIQSLSSQVKDLFVGKKLVKINVVKNTRLSVFK